MGGLVAQHAKHGIAPNKLYLVHIQFNLQGIQKKMALFQSIIGTKFMDDGGDDLCNI